MIDTIIWCISAIVTACILTFVVFVVGGIRAVMHVCQDVADAHDTEGRKDNDG